MDSNRPLPKTEFGIPHSVFEVNAGLWNRAWACTLACLTRRTETVVATVPLVSPERTFAKVFDSHHSSSDGSGFREPRTTSRRELPSHGVLAPVCHPYMSNKARCRPYFKKNGREPLLCATDEQQNCCGSTSQEIIRSSRSALLDRARQGASFRDFKEFREREETSSPPLTRR